MPKWSKWFKDHKQEQTQDTVSQMTEVKAKALPKSNAQTSQDFIDWLNATRPTMTASPEPDFGPEMEPEATARCESLA